MKDPYPAFTKALIETYILALEEAKYPAHHFRKMLAQFYGYETACKLVGGKDGTAGFETLKYRKRLDLTVEATILKKEWFHLFDKDTLSLAYNRLVGVYEFPAGSWNPDFPPHLQPSSVSEPLIQPKPKVPPSAPHTPKANDYEDTERVLQESYRIIRDTEIAREVKRLNSYSCQICGESIRLPDGTNYAEAHHIKPLGNPHSGPDDKRNLICVCPNHHVQLDYFAIPLVISELKTVSGHEIDQCFIDYHNSKVRTINDS